MIKNYTVFALLFFVALTAKAQLLIDQPVWNPHTYIYKLTNQEAEKVSKKSTLVVDSTYFHTLVDSFPSDSIYRGELLQGHYLKVLAAYNYLEIEHTSVTNFYVNILTNQTDLMVQVIDKANDPIADAHLKVGAKQLPFDDKTQSYRIPKSNRKGWLSINYDGMLLHYKLDRKYNNSRFKRVTKKVLYTPPIRYVWNPVRFVLHIPIDGVRTVIEGYKLGSIAKILRLPKKIANTANNVVNSVATIFDPSLINEKREANFQAKFKYFVAFDKAKYRIKDTVRCKVGLYHTNGKAEDMKLQAELFVKGEQSILLTRIPYREGNYTFEFALADSLGFQLDKRYRIAFKDKRGVELFSRYIVVEDYELEAISFKANINQKEHYKDKPIVLTAKAEDENSLVVPNVRVELFVLHNWFTQAFEPTLFLPDTLWTYEQSLANTGETKIAIPDSLFPKANFSYELLAKFTTPDNEYHEKRFNIDYYPTKDKIDIGLVADTLKFSYLEHGDNSVPKTGILKLYDGFNNLIEERQISMPHQEIIDPIVNQYTVNAGNTSQDFRGANQADLVNCYTKRNQDSVWVEVSNPRNLTFSYQLFNHNKMIERGYGKSLKWAAKNDGVLAYDIVLQYLWGGKTESNTFSIPLPNTNKMTIEVKQPTVVHPGEQTEIEILVADKSGNPIPNVDVTAWAMTSKFGYTAPRGPLWQQMPKERTTYNTWTLEKAPDNSFKKSTKYANHQITQELQKSPYYKFLHSKEEVFKYEYTPSDSITQFAPFVVDKGKLIPVEVVYLDYLPVFIASAQGNQPYSFQADSGYHKIRIRTQKQEITLDSVYLTHGKKLILSVKYSWDKATKTKRKHMPKKPNKVERRVLSRFLMYFDQIHGSNLSYIKSGERIIPLNEKQYSSQPLGPINFQNNTCVMLGSFQLNFKYEPFYRYTFGDQLVKMKSTDKEFFFQNDWRWYFSPSLLAEEVLTEEKMLKSWSRYLANERRNPNRSNSSHPRSTSDGKGTLQIKFKDVKTANEVLNVLIFKLDDAQFNRLYQGRQRTFYELEEGEYRLFFLMPNEEYFIEDSIKIQGNGLNFKEISKPDSLLKNNFSKSIHKLIETEVYRYKYSDHRRRELIRDYYIKAHVLTYTGVGVTVRGVIKNELGNVLPTATVIINGTNYGAVANRNGEFEIRLPDTRSTLTFNHIGYYSKNIKVYDVANSNSVVLLPIQKEENKPIAQKGLVIRGIVTVDGNDNLAFMDRKSPDPLFVIDGTPYSGELDEELLGEIESINILKGDSAGAAIYGSRAANGIYIINTTGKKLLDVLTQKLGEDGYIPKGEGQRQVNSIRSNFKDNAYWQPQLVTNEQGKVRFEVTFPDDITKWDTHVIAVSSDKRSAQFRGSIRAFKPVMSQLKVPRFMVAKDTAFAIGKTLNYSGDTLAVTTSLKVGNETLFSTPQICQESIVDTLPLVANESDTLQVTYSMKKEDGYFDGEKRDIPIFPKGVEVAKGDFNVLDEDTTITLQFSKEATSITISAENNPLNLVRSEVGHLHRYQYQCNEQLASKLKAYLVEKRIAKHLNEKFKYEQDIREVIRKLQRHQRKNGWGWWADSPTSYWISVHVIEALMEAEAMGYAVSIDDESIIARLELAIKNPEGTEKVRKLQLLNAMKALVNYQSLIASIDTTQLSEYEHMQLLLVKQSQSIDYQLDSLKSKRKETLFGNYYWESDKGNWGVEENSVLSTVLAYKLLRKKDSTDTETLTKIRNYLLENRQGGYWRNTYESALILETILPDWLDGMQVENSKLQLSGAINQEVTAFPFRQSLEINEQSDKTLTIRKTGSYPVYFSSYQHYWDQGETNHSSDAFEVQTYFSNPKDTLQFLTGGEKAVLTAKVRVKKATNYVMIEVPIPAGCSYASKNKGSYREVHREYFREKVSIFCQKLPEGVYEFKIELLPKYSGTYTLNPAKAEQMYFPVFYGRNGLKKVEVR